MTVLPFNMGIPIPGKDGLYIGMGPWKSWSMLLSTNAKIKDTSSEMFQFVHVHTCMIYAL